MYAWRWVSFSLLFSIGYPLGVITWCWLFGK
jgi:hypothetical protein